MKNRRKTIEKLIEENFSQKDNFNDDVHEEDNLVRRALDDLSDENIDEFPENDAFTNFSVFKSKSFPADNVLSSKTYKGKNVSRKSFEDLDSDDDGNISKPSKTSKTSKKIKRVTFDEPSSSDELESADDVDDEELGDSEDGEDSEATDDDDGYEEKEENSDGEDGSVEDMDDDSVEDESEIEDDVSDNEDIDASFMYSKAVRDETSDKEKGEAVRVQLNLCESLLESRITLQKALFATNQLPKPSKYEEMWAEFSEDEKSTVIQCRESVWDLLENFIRLQCKFRQRCPEFLETLNESAKKEYEEQEDSEPKIKRRKISEYPVILDKLHNQYQPYRTSVIQKWNDRTKAASGKLAKTNFSAFDVPIVKQIEQIFEDKQRLVEKTQLKRADYKIIGEAEINNDDQSSSTERDEEIFDDDDFYHKLLRDYIERKTADVSDPTQLGRKWIKLQSLRSKMKRKIDTRCTKGRKIKFNVHPKLVNFMAPLSNNRWTDTAINELYTSVFGNKVITS